MDESDTFNHWMKMQREYDDKIKAEIVRRFYGPKNNKFSEWHEKAIDVEFEVIEDPETKLLENQNRD